MRKKTYNRIKTYETSRKKFNTLGYLPNGNMTLTTKDGITTEFGVIIDPLTKDIDFKKPTVAINTIPTFPEFIPFTSKPNNVISIFKNRNKPGKFI